VLEKRRRSSSVTALFGDLMSLEDDKKTVLKAKPIYPTALPSVVAEECKDSFLTGFTDGWDSYKKRIKEDLKNIQKYGDIIDLANISVPYKRDKDIYKEIGFSSGWKSYGRFLKNTFFK
jgi:hypothetical protein